MSSITATVLASALLLEGCASPVNAPNGSGFDETSRAALACTLPSNCVNSIDGSDLSPLRYEGTPAQALSALEGTLATFPEAQIVRTDTLHMEVIFTTRIGFRDQVDFRIDPQSQRIDYRSRSLFGLFDLGKNRSRMREVSARFEQQSRR